MPGVRRGPDRGARRGGPDGPPPPPAAPAPVGKPAADEDDRGAYELEPAAKAAPVPEFRKGATRDEDDEDADDAPRRRARGRPGRSARRRSGKERAQRGVYIGCGSLAVVAGTALALAANASGEVNATKVIVVSVAFALFGLVSVVQGVTGHLPDDGD